MKRKAKRLHVNVNLTSSDYIFCAVCDILLVDEGFDQLINGACRFQSSQFLQCYENKFPKEME